MIHFRTSARKAPLAALGVLLAVTVLTGCHKPAAPGAPPKFATTNAAAGKTNAAAMLNTNLSLEFVSVFDDSLPRVNTRDPFYPDSTREVRAGPTGPTAPPPPPQASLKLHSIAGSAKNRLAVINNDILGEGEESDVKTIDGKVHVKILEIGEDYVILTVRGQTGQTRLTLPKDSLNPLKDKKP